MQMYGLDTPESPNKILGTQTLTKNRPRFISRKGLIVEVTAIHKETRQLCQKQDFPHRNETSQ